MYSKNLFYGLKELCESSPAKFSMNVSEYKGKKVAIFDYGIVTPKDFGVPFALETRGSLFEVDEDNNFVSVLALSYEKFFNLHEFDYDGTEGLKAIFSDRYGVEATSESIASLASKSTFMDKRDGSIISFFDFHGELDAKSNSSLTSDHKRISLELVNNDPELYDKIKRLTDSGFTVITEFTSKYSMYQIVMPYTEDQVIVTGVRSNTDGSYMSLEDILGVFGEKYTVDIIDTTKMVAMNEIGELEDTEGFIMLYKNLRVKIKTAWYLERHNTKSFVTVPSNVWVSYLEGKVDDIALMLADPDKELFYKLVNRCDELYTGFVQEAIQWYDARKYLDKVQFFAERGTSNLSRSANILASMLYTNTDHEQVMERFKESLMIRKNISRLGIPKW